jgi:hypothetical protein
MAQFTVRVELHNANGDDYNVLHTAMESEGFSRFITSDQGTRYHMPWAEYDGASSTLSRLQVLTAAQRADNRTGRTHGILVTESAGRTWDGLTKV